MELSKLSDKIGGFATIPNTVVKMIPVIGVEAFTLWSYLRYRTNGETGLAFPSYETIKADTGLHYRKVAKALRTLEESNLLARHKRFGNSTEYTLICPVLPPLEGKSSQRVQTNKTDSTKKEKKGEASEPKANVYAIYNSCFAELLQDRSYAALGYIEELETFLQEWILEAFQRTLRRERAGGDIWRAVQRMPYALRLLNEWKTASRIIPERTSQPKQGRPAAPVTGKSWDQMVVYD